MKIIIPKQFNNAVNKWEEKWNKQKDKWEKKLKGKGKEKGH